MADVVELAAGEFTHEHVGRALLLDTVWGPLWAEITAVQQDQRNAHLTVSIAPYADRGPIPMMVHRKPDLPLQLIVE